jgi:hypothetical protein
VPAMLGDSDINDEELMEYLYRPGTTSLKDMQKDSMPYMVACDAAEQNLVQSVTALAPLDEEEAKT